MLGCKKLPTVTPLLNGRVEEQIKVKTSLFLCKVAGQATIVSRSAAKLLNKHFNCRNHVSVHSWFA